MTGLNHHDILGILVDYEFVNVQMQFCTTAAFLRL